MRTRRSLKTSKVSKVLEFDPKFVGKDFITEVVENLEGGIEFVVPSFLKKMEPYRDYFFEEVLFVPEGFKLARGSKVWVDKEGDFLFPTEVLDGAKNAV